jgi:hypothetical protein
MEVTDELTRLWDEVIVVYFKVDYAIPVFILRGMRTNVSHNPNQLS